LFIYDSVSFVLLQYVPTGKQLKTLSWAQNGDYIAVCTLDGGLLVYELANLTLVHEFADKGLQYHDVIMDWGRKWNHEENLGQSLSAAKRPHSLIDHQEYTIGAILAQQAEKIANSDSGMSSNEMSAMVNASKSQASHHINGTVVASAGGAYHKVQVMRNGHVVDLNVVNDDSTSDSEFKKLTVTCMVLDTSRNVVVAGTKDGFLLLMLWPFEFAEEKGSANARCYARYAIHEGEVGALTVCVCVCVCVLIHPIINHPSYYTILLTTQCTPPHHTQVENLVLNKDKGVVYSTGADGNLFVLDLGVLGTNGAFQVRYQRRENKATSEANMFRSKMTSESRKKDTEWIENAYMGNPNIAFVERAAYHAITNASKQVRVWMCGSHVYA
jgi:hypothetical protein